MFSFRIKLNFTKKNWCINSTFLCHRCDFEKWAMADNNWSCQLCTFSNGNASTTCEACGAEKDAAGGEKHDQFFDLAHNMDDFFADIFDSLDDILGMDSCAICGVSFGLFNSYLECEGCSEAVCYMCCGRDKQTNKLECNNCVAQKDMIWSKQNGVDMLVPKMSVLGQMVPAERGGEGKQSKKLKSIAEDWSCGVCGYLNDGSMSSKACFCCSTPRPKEEEKPAASLSVPAKDEEEPALAKKSAVPLDKRKGKPWHCEKCLTANDASSQTCKQCSAPTTSFTFTHWACPLCTFTNEHRDAECFMCGSTRPDDSDELALAEMLARTQLDLTGDIESNTHDLKTVEVLREEKAQDEIVWGSISEEGEGKEAGGERKTAHHKEKVKDVLRPGGDAMAKRKTAMLPTTGKPISVGDPKRSMPGERSKSMSEKEQISKWEQNRRAHLGLDHIPTEFLKVEMTLTYTSLRPKKPVRSGHGAPSMPQITEVSEEKEKAEPEKEIAAKLADLPAAHEATDKDTWAESQKEARSMMNLWGAIHEEDFSSNISKIQDEHEKLEAVRKVFAPAEGSSEAKIDVPKAAPAPVNENAPKAPELVESEEEKKRKEREKTRLANEKAAAETPVVSMPQVAIAGPVEAGEKRKTVVLASGKGGGGEAKGRVSLLMVEKPKGTLSVPGKAAGKKQSMMTQGRKTLMLVENGKQKEVPVESRKEVGHTAVHEEALQKDLLAFLDGDKVRMAAVEKESQRFGMGKAPAYAYYYFLGKTFGEANIPLILPNLLKALTTHPKQQEALRTYHQYIMSRKCPKCGKMVYANEQMQGAGQTWHLKCFKCMHEGCNASLTQKTVQPHKGKIYCQNHIPMTKPKPWARSKSKG
eukprot:g45832.t1